VFNMTGEFSMERAEVSKLINSFNAIKAYFNTTKKYLPQIAKLVDFIEELIPLLNTIHDDLHQSTLMIPTASEKLDKVTSATELATTEVMDIVDRVIGRLNTMTVSLDEVDAVISQEKPVPSSITEKTTIIRKEIDGSQEDLFSIMNALQFQDITTQQICSIGQVIETVQRKLGQLLSGFDDEAFNLPKQRKVAFDDKAEYDFDLSKKSQEMADEFLKQADKLSATDDEKKTEEKDLNIDSCGNTETNIILGEDGQPDIGAIMNTLKKDK